MAVKPWLGAIVAPSKWKQQEDGSDAFEPPNELALECVYGYNSARRNNVFYSKNGQVVYFAAAAGVGRPLGPASLRAHLPARGCWSFDFSTTIVAQ